SENPNEIKEKIENQFPLLEIVAVYDTLFQGLALKGKTKEIKKLARANFITGYYPVQTYVTQEKINFTKYSSDVSFLFESKMKDLPFERSYKKMLAHMNDDSLVFPEELNDTKYTGKG